MTHPPVRSHTYRPTAKHWEIVAGAFALFGTFFGLSTFALLLGENGGQRGLGGFGVLAFGLLLTTVVVSIPEGLSSFVVDSDGIERWFLGRRARLDWREIETAWPTGEELTGYKMVGEGRVITLDTAALREGETLRRILDERLVGARTQAIQRAIGMRLGVNAVTRVISVLGGMTGIGVLIAIPFLVLASRRMPQLGGASAEAVFILIYGSGGVLLIVLAVSAWVKHIEIGGTGLEEVTLRGRRRVRYADMKRVELGTRSVPKSDTTLHTLTLEHPEGELKFDSNLEDFALLRDVVLAHVAPSIVRHGDHATQSS